MAKVLREALAARDPALLPVDETDPRLNTAYEPAPGYQVVQLDENVCLHLTDGRSFRNKNDLLSSGQRGLITSELERRPNHVHLLSTYSDEAASEDHSLTLDIRTWRPI